jgi:hypothetical protein
MVIVHLVTYDLESCTVPGAVEVHESSAPERDRVGSRVNPQTRTFRWWCGSGRQTQVHPFVLYEANDVQVMTN